MTKKTNREYYEAFIASLPADLAWQIASDAEDNAFFAGPAVNADDPRYLDALRTAEMIADDPKPYGYRRD